LILRAIRVPSGSAAGRTKAAVALPDNLVPVQYAAGLVVRGEQTLK
jgi:hypothetical protein